MAARGGAQQGDPGAAHRHIEAGSYHDICARAGAAGLRGQKRPPGIFPSRRGAGGGGAIERNPLTRHGGKGKRDPGPTDLRRHKSHAANNEKLSPVTESVGTQAGR